LNSILIVDDHPIIRVAVRALLEREGYIVVGESDNGLDALNKMKELNPDLVILDIGIPQLEGLDVIHRMQSNNIASRILILTSQSQNLFANRCRQAGASGFIGKETGLAELINGVKAVLAGYSFFPISSLDSVSSNSEGVSEEALLKKLSNREIMVLQYLASGYGTNEIADQMFISAKTVSTYKSHLRTKLGVSSYIEMVDFARRNKLMPVS